MKTLATALVLLFLALSIVGCSDFNTAEFCAKYPDVCTRD